MNHYCVLLKTINSCYNEVQKIHIVNKIKYLLSANSFVKNSSWDGAAEQFLKVHNTSALKKVAANTQK